MFSPNLQNRHGRPGGIGDSYNINVNQKLKIMNEQDITRFREISEKNYSWVTLKIESTLTYITAGALGFFIFVNARYLKYIAADYKFLLPISLSILFITFVLILVRKSRILKYEFDMLTFVARMDPASESQEQELVSIWDRNYMNRTTIQTISCIGLALGIGMQVLFMILNII